MGQTDKLEALYQALAQRALEAREAAYCPYSHFAVGAALSVTTARYTPAATSRTPASPPPTAPSAPPSSGPWPTATGSFWPSPSPGPGGRAPRRACAPCGVCRQVMAEFCGPDFEILLVGPESCTRTTLGALLPMAFGPGNLQ